MEFSAMWFLLFLTLPCFLGVDAVVVPETSIGDQGQHIIDRLLDIETLLQASLKKNSELEKRIEILEEDNRQLKATVELLGKDNGEDEKGDEGLKETDNAHTSTGILARELRVNQKRSGKVPRIVMSGEPTVAFTARVSSTLHNLGSGQTVVYGTVVTNVGGAYHNGSGIFLAPVSGVYVFSFMTMVEPGNAEYLELVKNGQQIQTSFAHGTGETRFESTSMVVTLEMNQGDEAWIQTEKDWVHGSGIIHARFSVFSGWLLAPWE